MREWVEACGSVSRGLHVLACVCHGWRILLLLVCMLDSPFAASVATLVFPDREIL